GPQQGEVDRDRRRHARPGLEMERKEVSKKLGSRNAKGEMPEDSALLFHSAIRIPQSALP
ncbi:MAG TPA: hypothetical protein VGL24_01145, partial [Chthoniobacterales bacterium]